MYLGQLWKIKYCFDHMYFFGMTIPVNKILKKICGCQSVVWKVLEEIQKKTSNVLIFGTICFLVVGINYNGVPIFEVPEVGSLGGDKGQDSILLMTHEL